MHSYDIIIIGGGVIGSAIARELTRWRLSVAVLEKESDVCTQTSARNTGMLHAGFLYKTGSLKARFSVEGNAEFDAVAKELGADSGHAFKGVANGARLLENFLLHEVAIGAKLGSAETVSRHGSSVKNTALIPGVARTAVRVSRTKNGQTVAQCAYAKVST